MRSKSRRGCNGIALIYVNPSVSFADSSPSGEPFGVAKLRPKSCPRKRGKWHGVPKGVQLKAAKRRGYSPADNPQMEKVYAFIS